jgi:ABC-type multidrug transport system fused ATPase/permease subunit
MQAASELLIACAILSLLIYINPGLTLALMSALALAVIAIYLITKRMNNRHGAQRSVAIGEMYRAASSALAGLKEIRVLGRQQTFLNRYEVASERYAKSNAHIMLMAQIPRLAFELLAFGGFVVVVFFVMKKSGDMKSALPLIATYSIAAYRLMPAFNKLVGAAMQMTFYRRTLDVVVRSISDLPDLVRRTSTHAATSALVPTVKLRVCTKKLSYTYPGAIRRALKDVSLTIPQGAAIGIVGPSGAGKSTLIDVILGLFDDYSGTIEVDGKVINSSDVGDWQKMIGYVPQAIYLADESLARNIAFGVPDIDVDTIALQRACDAAQLSEVISLLPDGLDTVVGERGVRLSGGQRQRVGIARALYHDPQILIFDEATSALDGLTEMEIGKEIDLLAGKKTLIIIAHRLSTIQKCSRIYVLEQGQITAEGTFAELSANSDYFARILVAA